MVGYAKESLEELRSKIDLLEVLSPHLKLTKSGGYHKALCPFHSEKTPSFVVQAGDSHYHCFGCGAHGDAIAFLMNHLQMTFSDAVETLAEKFGVTLEASTDEQKKVDPHVKEAKTALAMACEFFNYMLFYTDEGHRALEYLYKRGLDNAFVSQFQLGLAPKDPGFFLKVMKKKNVSKEALLIAGLAKEGNNGYLRPFFQDRITIPIYHPMGYVIGFSARLYTEEGFGPKYVNTPETPYFKKSRVLFGYNFSRKRIAKEQKAILVEGQIDALRLIEEGLDYTVASQGTAFGEEGVKELVRIGVRNVYLAFDADGAGKEAVVKVGQFFQKEAVAVWVVNLPENADPDHILKHEGPQSFIGYLDRAEEYIDFLVKFYSQKTNVDTPAGKSEVVRIVSSLIRSWEHPLMVHEGLRKLANVMHIPESVIEHADSPVNEVFIKPVLSVNQSSVDPDRILETDLLRLMLLAGSTHAEIIPYITEYIRAKDLMVPICQKVFEEVEKQHGEEKSFDLISLLTDIDDAEQKLFLSDILQKKIQIERSKDSAFETVKKILQRNWLRKREEIKARIQSGGLTDEEVLALAKMFDEIKREPPLVTPLQARQ